MAMNKVLYFSGTGNSKYIAEKIFKGIEGDNSLLAIRDCFKNQTLEFELSPGDSVGIICPIYFWGLPSMVNDFLENLVLNNYSSKSNPIYIIFSCGGSTGLADKMANKLLRKKGYVLSAAFSIHMPDNYNIMFDFMTPVNEIESVLLQAEGRITSIVGAVSDLCSSFATDNHINVTGLITRYKGESLLHRGPFPFIATNFSYPLYRSGRKTKPFTVSDVCIECGLCVKVCPLGIIHLEDRTNSYTDKQLKRPVWDGEKCTQCLACLHHCPVRAIQYGNRTQKRGRYLNPKTSLVKQDQD